MNGECYWCIYCLRAIAPEEQADGSDLYVHDEVPHPEEFDFTDESRPQ